MRAPCAGARAAAAARAPPTAHCTAPASQVRQDGTAFGVLLADEHVREKRGGAPPDAVFVRRTSDPVAGSVQGEAPDARLRGDGPRSDNLS